ncbi:MAG: hypothetical protein FWG64_02670 [Firmicutes bacterium]|nr:hypothetical protein [Bacillota bacterium]
MIVFDLHNDLEPLTEGKFDGTKYLKPLCKHSLYLELLDDHGLKTVKASQRESREDGMLIDLPKIAKDFDLRPNDRITVTGRISSVAPKDDWGMELMRGSSEWWGQLAQQITPVGIYSMSYLLEDIDLEHDMWVCTNHWGEEEPTMDFTIDSILVFRPPVKKEEESRKVLYSLLLDDFIQGHDDNTIIPLAEGNKDDSPEEPLLRKSGNPIVVARKSELGIAIYVEKRKNDWDGMDIRLEPLELKKGNKYYVEVTGKVFGEAGEGAAMTLQGVPTYTWADMLEVGDDSDFVLTHVLTQSNLETWTAWRITTNNAGIKLGFMVDSIEIGTI